MPLRSFWYKPLNGSRSVGTSTAGRELLVAVNKDTLTFNREDTPVDVSSRSCVGSLLPPGPALDWSKAPSRYFNMKLENLTTMLSLTDDQQTKIKPILEQESSELDPYWNNPVVSKRKRNSTFSKKWCSPPTQK